MVHVVRLGAPIWAVCVVSVLAGCGGTAGATGAPDPDATKADAVLSDTGAADVTATDVPTADVAPADVPLTDALPTDSILSDVTGQDTTTADVALTDASAPDADAAATADAASDADSGLDVGPNVQCATAPASFPSFDRTCTQDTDCAVAIHQINCCGTHLAWGIAASAKTAFDAAEAICDAQYPKCGCPAFQTMAEDGFGTVDTAAFATRCDAGTCRSFVPGAKAECTSSGMTAPLPVKTCNTDNDCAVVTVTVDCCGSQQAVGIAKFAESAFSAAQAICSKGGAICDCMPQPTTQEDGKPLVLDGSIGCIAGQCKTGIW